MKQRSIAVAILLSLVTCGIYGIYWFVCLTDDANLLSERTADTSGGVAFLLNLVTCGIYGIYWAYKMGEKLNAAKALRGMPTDSNSSILYLLLSIFGLGIVAWALMQNELNSMIPESAA
ncbi:MAG: DUF4234 domain-containing protein [Provencibacterium sp.]|jgi:cbb3-type cytochrome oxidase subunit 3|nr:DUF4234 domain-containing protein [Provencibacterium sp.]